MAPPFLPPPAALDAARLKQLYSTMLGCRLLAERAGLLVSQGLFPEDLSFVTGHEAAEVGALINVAEEDCVASGGREYIARFIQGSPLRQIFADLCAGTAGGRQASSRTRRPVDAMVPCSSFNAQLNLLTGAAWAFKLHRKPQVAVSLSGDHSHDLDVVHDAVSFAAAYQLPIIYMVENRASEGGKARPDPEMQDLGVHHHDLPCFVVDAGDVVAVYRVAQEAIRRARQGHGPALIECRSFGPGIQSRAVAADGHAVDDPLAKMEAHLRSKGMWSDKWKTKLVQRFTGKLDQATAFARRLPRNRSKNIALPSAGNANLGRSVEKDENNVLTRPVFRDSGRLAGSRG